MGLSAGTRLGPYEVLGAIGAGGMGEIYRASDTRLNRIVAIKVLPSGVADSPTRRQRFEREARAISALGHPHICTLYDVGEQDGVPYLVMEYLAGETLAARLGRGPLPIDEVLRHATEIADALDHAHRLGVVHRDLKPANIMLTRSGVKLLDFGVVKLCAPHMMSDSSLVITRPADTLTEEGAIIGTPRYMAPEQLEGREADARTDLFAFGAIVHEMTAGRPAFDGPSQASVIAAILEREPASLSAVRPEAPPLLNQIVTRCLAKNPDDRWQTASDLKQALTWIADGSAQIDRVAQPASPARRRHRGWLAAAALGVLAALIAIGLAVTASRRAQTDTARPFRFVVPPPEGTNFSQSSAFMEVSPDGHSLAFVASSREGNNALWVRSLDSLNARQLPGTDGAIQPFWSPDSRFLAFSDLGQTLKKIDVASGLVQTVVRSPTGYGTWNSDGVILYQVSGRGGHPIYRVAASGESPTLATSLNRARGETHHGWPRFLPDGRHFLFVAQSAQPEHDGVVYVGSLDSTDRIRILSADSHAEYDPEGYLLYMRANTLVAQAFDATSHRLTGEPMPVVEQVERMTASLRGAFSTSKTGVLAYRPIAETRLAWYDRSGRQLQSIGRVGSYSNPALSPDEQRLAVGRLDFESGASDIWVIDLARDGLESRLTFDAARDDIPSWSPDGRRIVFKSGRRFHQKTATGTGDSEVLLTSPNAFDIPLEWSHDGRALLFQASDSNTGLDVWRLPLEGDRQPVAVLQTRFQELQAHLSPDGRWIAYVSNESGRNEVYVQAFPSGEAKRPVSTQGGLEPAWRRDGSELFYLALDRTLMSVGTTIGSTFDAGRPMPLVETRMSVLLNPGYTRNQYVVSADGQRFLINQPPAEALSSPITVVVNWPAALKK